MNRRVKKMTFAAMIASIYFVLCLAEGNLASGFMVNVRIAEGLAVFAFFCPEVIIGTTIGCFLYNLFFGFGIIDALIGTTATLIGTTSIYLIGRFTKIEWVKLVTFGLPLTILNAFLVPIVLIISIEDLSWNAYWAECGIVAVGEALAVYVVGIALYFSCKGWMPRFLNSDQQETASE